MSTTYGEVVEVPACADRPRWDTGDPLYDGLQSGLDHGVGHPITFWSSPWLAAVG